MFAETTIGVSSRRNADFHFRGFRRGHSAISETFRPDENLKMAVSLRKRWTTTVTISRTRMTLSTTLFLECERNFHWEKGEDLGSKAN